MKNLIFPLFLLLFLTQCTEEKPLIDQAIEARCACLEKYDKEADNILEVIGCSNEVSNTPKFADLDPEKVMEGMEKHCPNAALPQSGMIQ